MHLVEKLQLRAGAASSTEVQRMIQAEKSSHCQLPGIPAFQSGTGQRQGLSERKRRGGKLSKVLYHQLGLGLVFWVCFMLAAMHSP